MKRSKLKEFIKGEIFSSLSEASPEEVQNQKELNKELEKTSKLSKEIGLEEANTSEFKVGDKVTYLGHPAEVTATKEYNGRNFVSVSYDKGNGATSASMILTTSGDIKLDEIGMFNDPIGYKITTPKKEIFTKKFISPGVYDIFKNGVKVKTIDGGEGAANAYMNQLKREMSEGMSEENIGLADIGEMGYEAGEEAFENIKSRFKNKPDHQAYRKGFFQGYIDNAGSYGLNEDIDDDNEDETEKDAIAQANAARGKHKKLDIAVKALKDITTEMKSLARDYSKADGAEKEKIKDQLKVKTPKKKELEALVAKLEKNVI